MAAKFISKHKLNSTKNIVPASEELIHGEIAINNAAGAENLYIKNSDNKVIPFMSGAVVQNTLDGMDSKIKAISDRVTTVEPGGLKYYTLPIAKDTVLGGVKTNFPENAEKRDYPVKTDVNGNAYVHIPWSNTTYNNATTVSNGLMSAEDKAAIDKFKNDYKLTYSNSSNNYGVKSSGGSLYVNINDATESQSGLMTASDKKNLNDTVRAVENIDSKLITVEATVISHGSKLTTLETSLGTLDNKIDNVKSSVDAFAIPKAANDTLGGIKLGSNKNYAVKLDTDDRAYVEVPVATTTANGLMSSTDRTTLNDGIVADIMYGNSVSTQNKLCKSVKKNGATNISALPEATQEKNGIMSVSDKVKLDSIKVLAANEISTATVNGWFSKFDNSSTRDSIIKELGYMALTSTDTDANGKKGLTYYFSGFRSNVTMEDDELNTYEGFIFTCLGPKNTSPSLKPLPYTKPHSIVTYAYLRNSSTKTMKNTSSGSSYTPIIKTTDLYPLETQGSQWVLKKDRVKDWFARMESDNFTDKSNVFNELSSIKFRAINTSGSSTVGSVMNFYGYLDDITYNGNKCEGFVWISLAPQEVSTQSFRINVSTVLKKTGTYVKNNNLAILNPTSSSNEYAYHPISFDSNIFSITNIGSGGGSGATISLASDSNDGLMSKEDKKKLNGLPTTYLKAVVLSKAEYNNLSSKDNNTLYCIPVGQE